MFADCLLIESMGCQEEEQRLGVLHLGKTHSRKRNPKRTKRTNFTRSALTEEDKRSIKYAQVEPLYHMWCEYYRSLLGEREKTPDERMLKADYHGALVLVAEAHNPTMFLYFSVIPKQGTALQFILDGRVFTLFGDAMRYKPSLRGKKHRLRVALPFFIR
ncbi:POP4 domain-containing protein [Trichostrongylus colubriformis]|uniref:Ribonuclease P protein subunit p29 n=1 Tax=Trichostrongylus colubriformis TaxID=6319 RepID=A0AAN8IHD3_TRICO